VVRSKEQNNSISMDRYELMRAVGAEAQPSDESILLRNLGAPVLPPLTNGQPPVGGSMATMPPPAQGATRPGAATGTGSARPAPQAQPGQPEFRPVQPAQPEQPGYRPASPTQK
jgi:general secretion pathway protein D